MPIYRDQTFVIAIDGAIIAGPNFANVVTDIAVLRSLGINVVLVHGIGRQLVEGARERGIKISDVHGENPVDDATLSLSQNSRLCGAGDCGYFFDEGSALRFGKCCQGNGGRHNIRG